MKRLLNEPVALGAAAVMAAAWLMTFTNWTPDQEAGFVTLVTTLAGIWSRAQVAPETLVRKRLAENRDPLTGKHESASTVVDLNPTSEADHAGRLH